MLWVSCRTYASICMAVYKSELEWVGGASGVGPSLSTYYMARVVHTYQGVGEYIGAIIQWRNRHIRRCAGSSPAGPTKKE